MMRTPSPISQPMPMDTLGPILQSLPILAVGCTMLLPINCWPAASSPGLFCFSDERCSSRPAGHGVSLDAHEAGPHTKH